MSTRRGGRGRGSALRREAARGAEAAVGFAAPQDPTDKFPWPAWAREATDTLVEGAGVSRRTAGAVVGVALDQARRAEVGRDLRHAAAVRALAEGRPAEYQVAPVPPLGAGSRARLSRVQPAVAPFLPTAALEALSRAARHGAPGRTNIYVLAWTLAAGAAAALVLAVRLHP